MRIAAVTDVLPLGSRVNGDPASMTLVVTPKVYDALVQEVPDVANSQEGIFLTSNNPDKTEAEITRFAEQNVQYRIGVTNISSNRQEENQLQKLILVFVYGFIVLITCICVANIFNTISTSVALRRREFAMLKSVGMTPKGFNRMIRFESLFYGLKSLLYGLPLGFLAMYLFYNTLSGAFEVPFMIPWGSIAVVVVSVFAIVSVTMLYPAPR
ncbi:MAG: ABC transporter permease [Oscillospiraceae bacterium]